MKTVGWMRQDFICQTSAADKHKCNSKNHLYPMLYCYDWLPKKTRCDSLTEGFFWHTVKWLVAFFFFQLRDTDAVPTLLNKAESVSEISAGLLIAWADSLSARLSPTVPSGMRAWVKPLLLWIPPLNTVSQHPPGGLNTPKHPGCPNTVPTMHTYRLMQYRYPPIGSCSTGTHP